MKKSKHKVGVRGDRDIDLSISLYLVTADFAGNKRSSLQAGILTKFGQKSLLDEPTEDRHIVYDQLVIWVCFQPADTFYFIRGRTILSSRLFIATRRGPKPMTSTPNFCLDELGDNRTIYYDQQMM